MTSISLQNMLLIQRVLDTFYARENGEKESYAKWYSDLVSARAIAGFVVEKASEPVRLEVTQ